MSSCCGDGPRLGTGTRRHGAGAGPVSGGSGLIIGDGGVTICLEYLGTGDSSAVACDHP